VMLPARQLISYRSVMQRAAFPGHAHTHHTSLLPTSYGLRVSHTSSSSSLSSYLSYVYRDLSRKYKHKECGKQVQRTE